MRMKAGPVAGCGPFWGCGRGVSRENPRHFARGQLPCFGPFGTRPRKIFAENERAIFRLQTVDVL